MDAAPHPIRVATIESAKRQAAHHARSAEAGPGGGSPPAAQRRLTPVTEPGRKARGRFSKPGSGIRRGTGGRAGITVPRHMALAVAINSGYCRIVMDVSFAEAKNRLTRL